MPISRPPHKPSNPSHRLAGSKPTIHSLPGEVTYIVHDYVLGDPTDYSRVRYYQVVITLMLVCKTWRLLIDNRPDLWSVIYPIDLPTEIVNILLEKSGSAPLSIVGSTTEPLSLHELDAIMPHARRWRVVTGAVGGDTVDPRSWTCQEC